MRKLLTMRAFTSLLIIFMMAGFAQAQLLPAISGKVTAGDSNDPVANFKMVLSYTDSTVFPIKFVTTDSEGNYFQQVVPGLTYTLSAIDTFSYEPFSADISVGTESVVYDIHLNYRTQDATLSGTVTSEDGSDVTGMKIFLLKLPDDTDLSDFEEIETHWEIPYRMTQWASYETEVASDGSYSVDVLFGKYVLYVPAGETTLTHWGVFEVTADMTYDIFLRTKKILSGHIENADQYDFVQVNGFSLSKGRPFTAVPDSNGDYQMEVPTGQFILRLTAFFQDDEGNGYMYAVYYDGVYTVEEATVVDVQDDTPGIDFTLPAAEVYPFSISGMVISENDSTPIANAKVSFVSYNIATNLWQWYMDSTDADGKYTVNGKTVLQEDSLIGFAYADGYFGEFYDNAATHVNATPIVYHANEDVTGIDFALNVLDTTNAHAISGTLYDEEGNVVGQGQVTAFTNATNVGVISAQVDSNGHYDFGPVFPEGSTVYLEAWGGYNYLINIYDNAESWEDATPISIGKDDVTIDFVMIEKAPARHYLAEIKGLVGIGQDKTESETSPLEGAVVYVKRQGDSEWLNSGNIDAQGNFELGVESDGVYEVKITAKGYKDYYNDNVVVEDRSADLNVSLTPTAIGSGNTGVVIESPQLFNAYPNPFNPSTTIRVNMTKSEVASLVIYNVIGQKVKTLHTGLLAKGMNEFRWNATDDAGRQVASGLYFYQLKTGNSIQTKAVMFIK